MISCLVSKKMLYELIIIAFLRQESTYKKCLREE